MAPPCRPLFLGALLLVAVVNVFAIDDAQHQSRSVEAAAEDAAVEHQALSALAATLAAHGVASFKSATFSYGGARFSVAPLPVTGHSTINLVGATGKMEIGGKSVQIELKRLPANGKVVNGPGDHQVTLVFQGPSGEETKQILDLSSLPAQ